MMGHKTEWDVGPSAPPLPRWGRRPSPGSERTDPLRDRRPEIRNQRSKIQDSMGPAPRPGRIPPSSFFRIRSAISVLRSPIDPFTLTRRGRATEATGAIGAASARRALTAGRQGPTGMIPAGPIQEVQSESPSSAGGRTGCAHSSPHGRRLSAPRAGARRRRERSRLSMNNLG